MLSRSWTSQAAPARAVEIPDPTDDGVSGRVLLCDGQSLTRPGLWSILASYPGWDVVGEAYSVLRWCD